MNECDKPKHRVTDELATVRQGSDGVEAEPAFRQSETGFRSIAAVVHDAIIMMDSDGNISFWNDAAKAISDTRQKKSSAGIYMNCSSPPLPSLASVGISHSFARTARGQPSARHCNFMGLGRMAISFLWNYPFRSDDLGQMEFGRNCS